MYGLGHKFFPLSKLGEAVYDPKLDKWGKILEVYYGYYEPHYCYLYLVAFPYPGYPRHKNTGKLKLSWRTFPAWEIVKSSSVTATHKVREILDEIPIIKRN